MVTFLILLLGLISRSSQRLASCLLVSCSVEEKELCSVLDPGLYHHVWLFILLYTFITFVKDFEYIFLSNHVILKRFDKSVLFFLTPGSIKVSNIQIY